MFYVKLTTSQDNITSSKVLQGAAPFVGINTTLSHNMNNDYICDLQIVDIYQNIRPLSKHRRHCDEQHREGRVGVLQLLEDIDDELLHEGWTDPVLM